MWIDLDGLKFNTDLIACLKPTDDGEQTIVFCAGQSAVDGGFLIDLPIEEAFRLVQQARYQELAEMVDNEAAE